jgi:NADPH2:quinone reductase
VKAAVYHRVGPAKEVPRLEEIPRPTPASGEARVRVEVSGVNPTEVKARSGEGPT